MEHIPTKYVADVLKNFRHCTRKVCYLSIATLPDGFGPQLVGEPLHLTVKKPDWWFAQLSAAGFRVYRSAVEPNKNGQ